MPPRRKLLTTAFFLLTAWASVGGSFGWPDTRILDGCVVDGATGAALAGAKVALLETSGVHMTTGADGRFYLPALDGSSFTLRIFKTGYAPRDVYASHIMAEPGASTRIHLHARHSGRVAELPVVEVVGQVDYVPNLAVAPVRPQAAR